MHDERGSVLLVVDRSALERLSICQRLTEAIQYLFVSGCTLQDARGFPDHFFR